jgi:hypothetical protein
MPKDIFTDLADKGAVGAQPGGCYGNIGWRPAWLGLERGHLSQPATDFIWEDIDQYFSQAYYVHKYTLP